MTYANFKTEMQRQRADSDAARNDRVVTAVHVARDWAIEQHGNRNGVSTRVADYLSRWLKRNRADDDGYLWYAANDITQAVWALAELPQQDPLTLVDDDWRGTSDEARAMLIAQYERDLQHALSRITWKD